jgi:hypothetical protein
MLYAARIAKQDYKHVINTVTNTWSQENDTRKTINYLSLDKTSFASASASAVASEFCIR